MIKDSRENRWIYVDMDDVLCQTIRSFLDILKSSFDKTVPYEKITSFDLGISFGLSPDELQRFMDLGHKPEVLDNLYEMDESRQPLSELIRRGYLIDIVTGRIPYTYETTRKWLERHEVNYHRLTFVNKYNFSGDLDQYPFVISLAELSRRKYCCAIEDSGEMAVYIAREMNVPVLLLDRPWNRNGVPGPEAGIHRLTRWNQVLDCIETATR